MNTLFQTFCIEGYDFDIATLTAYFHYSFDENVYFTEEICFSCDDFPIRSHLDRAIIDDFLFHISIAVGISYYKLSPTQQIRVKTGALDKESSVFWNKFYISGLGEFFYQNQIDPTGLAQFSSDEGSTHSPRHILVEEKAIVPIGGGKDSIVTIEKIRDSGVMMDLFTFGKENPIYRDTERVSEYKRLFVQRKISPKLFELNAQGQGYNGHVPITGIISFVLTLVSYLYGYKYIVWSNEQSSNFGNLEFAGLSINHQYSKSLEFENDFRQYLKNYISPDIEYFSMMRPYYEVNIIKQFTQYQQYFEVFTSCNRNFHLLEKKLAQDIRWCLHCPKCAFVFACIHPHISTEECNNIFHGNMYEDMSLIPLFEELTGISGHKPFECVGTNEEILWSMHTSIVKLGTENLPPILDHIFQKVLKNIPDSFWEDLEIKLFREYPHNIPPIFQVS